MPELFDGVAIAAGIQTVDYDTKDPTIDGLTSPLTSADGIILGYKEAGDANTGITIPNLEGDWTEKPDVAASFSQTAATLKKVMANGLVVSWLLQGNGATVSSTPANGECKPLKGIDALLEACGIDGANGVAPVYEYTPRSSTVYVTIKMWVGDQAMVFTGCLVDTITFAITPGGNVIVTATISVGKLPTADVDDDIVFPTLDFTTQESLEAPVVAGVNMTGFGETRGANLLSVTITNTVEEIGDTAVAVTGMRKAQVDRIITVDGTLYSKTADSDSEWQSMIGGAPTDDLSFQVGTVAGGDDVANAFLFECNNLQVRDMKYEKRGDQLAVTLNGARCTTTSGAGAGTEFKLTFN